MTANEIIILNFEEIRRRSIKLWNGLPITHYTWKPDAEAMSCIEMIRHVLEAEHLFHIIVTRRGNLGDYTSPWGNLPYTTLEAELSFAQPYRKGFIDAIHHFTPEELSSIEIIRSEKNQRKVLGDYLNRIAYHESVHTGQFLNYMRTLQIERPLIWD
jgi:uncharacterized damage-inducible protein DinB